MSDIGLLQAELDRRANPQTKAWWEAYLKGAIPFRGVKMAGTRAALHEWLATTEPSNPVARRELALSLLRETACEDKLAGILYLQEVLIPSGILTCADLPQLAQLFEQGYIADWNTCDWFCVKVLGPLIEREGAACAQEIAAWSTANTLWQRRAAGVAFVNLAAQGEANFPGFTNLLLQVNDATLRSPERFAQTGTGWVLRELSVAEPDRVIRFIEEHLSLFSSEGLRYATAKLDAETQARLKMAHKALPRAIRP